MKKILYNLKNLIFNSLFLICLYLFCSVQIIDYKNKKAFDNFNHFFETGNLNIIQKYNTVLSPYFFDSGINLNYEFQELKNNHLSLKDLYLKEEPILDFFDKSTVFLPPLKSYTCFSIYNKKYNSLDNFYFNSLICFETDVFDTKISLLRTTVY